MGCLTNQRRQLLGVMPILLQDFIEIHPVHQIERLRDYLLVFGERSVEFTEIRIDKVRDANASARDLVFVTRSDAAGRSADSRPVLPAFRNFFERTMERKDHVSAIAYL